MEHALYLAQERPLRYGLLVAHLETPDCACPTGKVSWSPGSIRRTVSTPASPAIPICAPNRVGLCTPESTKNSLRIECVSQQAILKAASVTSLAFNWIPLPSVGHSSTPTWLALAARPWPAKRASRTGLARLRITLTNPRELFPLLAIPLTSIRTIWLAALCCAVRRTQEMSCSMLPSGV